MVFSKIHQLMIPSDYFLLLTWEINPAQSSSGPPSSKLNKLLDSTWFNFTGSSSTGLAPRRRSGVDSKVLAQLGTALLQPKCSISSRASPWERRRGTMVNCFYLFRAPCVIPDQVRMINQGVGESIRTEHSFIRTPLAP